MGVDISDVEYETQIDHMTRTGIRIALDAVRTVGWVRAEFYGESWEEMRHYSTFEEWSSAEEIIEYWQKLWSPLFSEPMPDIKDTEYGIIGIDREAAERLRKQIARYILDQIYDVEELY